MRRRTTPSGGHGSASRARCSAAAARTASVARGKARKTPSPAQSTSRPPRARADSRTSSRSRARTGAKPSARSECKSLVEPSMSAKSSVTVPPGSCLLGSSRTGMSERVYEARSVPPSGGADRIRGRSCGVCLRSRAGELAGGSDGHLVRRDVRVPEHDRRAGDLERPSLVPARARTSPRSARLRGARLRSSRRRYRRRSRCGPPAAATGHLRSRTPSRRGRRRARAVRSPSPGSRLVACWSWSLLLEKVRGVDASAGPSARRPPWMR